MHRRQLLAGLAGGLSLVAGCINLLTKDGDGTDTPQPTTEPPPSPTPTPTPMETPTAEPTHPLTHTQTLSPTPTSSSSPTRPRSPTTTPRRTGTRPGTPGAPVIDPSHLATYTSDSYPYTVKYPAGWEIDRTPLDPGFAVIFSNPSGPAEMSVDVGPDAGTRYTRETAVRTFIRKIKQDDSQSSATVTGIDRWEVTLPNGHRATRLDIALTSVANVQVRLNYLFTIVAETLYGIGITMPEATYTPRVKQGVTVILTSLTIDAGGSSTVAQRGRTMGDQLA